MPKLRPSPILLVLNIALIVYGMTALFSFFTAYDLNLSIPTVGAIVISIILFFIIMNTLRHLAPIQRFAMVMGAAGLLLSLLFISQFAYQNYIETPDVINRIGTLTTILPNLNVFIHQNSAATFIELLVPIVLALIWLGRRTGRIFWIVTLLVMLYAFLLTYSRGAYLGLAVALLLGVGVIGAKRLSGRQAIGLLVAIIALVIVFVSVLVVLGPRMPFVASLIGVTESRLEIYRNSLELAGDYLFTGIGVGDTFAMVYSRYSLLIFVPLFTYTHNLFLAVLLGQGIFGFVSFMIVILAYYLFAARVLWVVNQADISPIFYGALIGVTATLVHGLTDARQYVESPFNLPLLFMGMALTVVSGIYDLRAEAFENPESNKGGGWRTLTAVSAVALVIVVAGVVIFNKQVLAVWHTNLGALAEIKSDGTIFSNVSQSDRQPYVQQARDQYQQALAIDPDYPNANRRLGNLDVGEEQFAAAVPLLDKAYAAEQKYQASIKGLGLASTWTGQTSKAACVFKQLSDVQAMDQELYSWQDFRHSQGQDLLAAYALETAAMLEDYQQTNMDVWVRIGDLYQAAGKSEFAQEWYNRVLQKDPNNTTASDKLKASGGGRNPAVMTNLCS